MDSADAGSIATQTTQEKFQTTGEELHAMRKLPQQIICDHCGYITAEESKRLGDVGDEGAWICPACELCNTSYHLEHGFVTHVGYERDLEIGFL